MFLHCSGSSIPGNFSYFLFAYVVSRTTIILFLSWKSFLCTSYERVLWGSTVCLSLVFIFSLRLINFLSLCTVGVGQENPRNDHTRKPYLLVFGDDSALISKWCEILSLKEKGKNNERKEIIACNFRRNSSNTRALFGYRCLHVFIYLA